MFSQKSIFFLILILTAISCGKAPLPKTDWQKENLKGEVKVVYEKRFYVDTLGVLNDSTYWDSIDVRPNLTIEFNKKGYVVKRIDLPCFFGGGTTTYNYSETNSRLQKICIGSNMGSGSGEVTYEYDTRGFVKRAICVYPDAHDSIIVEFPNQDKRGNILKEVHNSYFDTNDYYLIRKYDKFDHIIEETRFDLVNDIPRNKTIFEYDSFGNKIYSEFISLDKSNWVWKSWYSYDKNGNHLRDSSKYIDNGKPWDPGVDTYKYEFDDKGNWYQMVIFNNGKIDEIVRRKIIYW